MALDTSDIYSGASSHNFILSAYYCLVGDTTAYLADTSGDKDNYNQYMQPKCEQPRNIQFMNPLNKSCFLKDYSLQLRRNKTILIIIILIVITIFSS